MPKKTRQQKILAELRSLKKELQVPQAVPSNPTPNSYQVNQERVANPITISPVNAIAYDYSYLFKDLRKVAVLSTIAILIEVVLSLTLNIGFANLFKELKFF